MFDNLMELFDFLPCQTPAAWLSHARDNLPILLIDHAHCEKKAASSALSLIHKYPQHTELLSKMSTLAREELLHFEKVLQILTTRNITFNHLPAGRYAASLREQIRSPEPERLIDALIIGAFIEARSCERFHALMPHVDNTLAKFFQSLLKSEARHFRDYLTLAQSLSHQDITPRVDLFRTLEQDLIESPDTVFRFHSGVCS